MAVITGLDRELDELVERLNDIFRSDAFYYKSGYRTIDFTVRHNKRSDFFIVDVDVLNGSNYSSECVFFQTVDEVKAYLQGFEKLFEILKFE